MDPHVRWLRRSVALRIARHCLVVWALAAVALAPLLRAAGMSWREAAAWAALGGQLAVSLRVAAALRSNPLGVRFLASYVRRSPRFAVAAVEGAPHAASADLMACGLAPVATMVDATTAAGPVFDLHRSRNGIVVGAVARDTGTVALATRLEDGRILHTADLLVVPVTGVVVNTVPGASTVALADAHAAVLRRLGHDGCRAVATAPTDLAQLHELEHGAYRQLGPWFGAFVDLVGRRSARLLVRLDPAEVLDRTAATPGGLPAVPGAGPGGVASSTRRPDEERSAQVWHVPSPWAA